MPSKMTPERACAILADYLHCMTPARDWASMRDAIAAARADYNHAHGADSTAIIARWIAEQLTDKPRASPQGAYYEGHDGYGAFYRLEEANHHSEMQELLAEACEIIEHAARLPLRAQALHGAIQAARRHAGLPAEAPEKPQEAPEKPQEARDVPLAAFAHLTAGPAL